jgi:hypothetical protein
MVSNDVQSTGIGLSLKVQEGKEGLALGGEVVERICDGQ